MKITFFLFSLVFLGCAKGEPVPGGGGTAGFDAGSDTGGSGGSDAASGGTGGIGATGGSDAATGGSGGSGAGPCTPPVSGTCDTFPQCGCNPGERCDVVNTTGETGCVGDGTVEPFKACAAGTPCKAGSACVGNVCKPFCSVKTDCSGGNCIQVLSDPGGQGTPIPGFMVCTAACSLVNPVAICGTQAGCYPDTETPTGTDCGSAGVGTGPGTCTGTGGQANPTSCAPGFACVAGAQAGAWDCRKWCRIGFSTDCPGGASCSAFAPPNSLFIDGIEHGVCP